MDKVEVFENSSCQPVIARCTTILPCYGPPLSLRCDRRGSIHPSACQRPPPLSERVLKISVTICNVTSVKMRRADFEGIVEIASLPEGPLEHKNVLISGISKHAL